MKITVVGTGYVGLVTGACFANAGNDVICLDKDKKKIEALSSLQMPFFEPGLENLVKKSSKKGKLNFQFKHDENSLSSEVYFIAVGTPQSKNGSVDMSHVHSAAEEIGKGVLNDAIVVNKSTMGIGATAQVKSIIDKEILSRDVPGKISVIANPEFLREGSAVDDFEEPDRIIIGSDDPEAIQTIKILYANFLNNDESNLIVMDAKSAELTKYAANAMLASRISFMNEIALISDSVGADIKSIKEGIGSDKRIGNKFLNPGIGYGGSCFPKDLNALIYSSKELGIDLKLIPSVQQVNESQIEVILNKLKTKLNVNNLIGIRIAVWGLSYKPDTDDVREAPSITLIQELLDLGADITAYDPVSIKHLKSIFPETSKLKYEKTSSDCLQGSEVLIICTEWREFIDFNFKKFKGNTLKFVLDGRNCIDKSMITSLGLDYEGIGW